MTPITERRPAHKRRVPLSVDIVEMELTGHNGWVPPRNPPWCGRIKLQPVLQHYTG